MKKYRIQVYNRKKFFERREMLDNAIKKYKIPINLKSFLSCSIDEAMKKWTSDNKYIYITL